MLDAPGGPSNPLAEERLRAKFFECAETVLDRRTAGRVEATVSRLDRDDGALSDLCSAIGAG